MCKGLECEGETASFARGRVLAELGCVADNLEVLHLIGIGMYSLTLSVFHETSSLLGKLYKSNVTRITPDNFGWPSIFLVNLNTECTYWTFNISSLGSLIRKGTYMVPLIKVRPS